MSMTIFQKREKRKRAVYSAASSMLIHLSLAISDIFSPPDGLCITIQPSDKLQFVEVGISHTITPSRTRLPHLAHDYPISHTNTPISHTITPISYTISKSAGMGFL